MKLFLITILFMLPLSDSLADISFSKEIAPLLVKRCLSCHNASKKKGGYSLETFERLLRSGKSGEAPIIPGNHAKSYLYKLILTKDEIDRMPQDDDPFNENEKQLVKKWIDEGASFDGPSKEDKLFTLLPPRVHPQAPEEYGILLPVFSGKISLDGKYIYTAGYHEILLWTVEGKLEKRYGNLPERIQALELSQDGKFMFVAGGAPGDYGEIRKINLESGEVEVLCVAEDSILSLKISPDGTKLVAGGADRTIRVYDILTSKLLWRNKHHAHWVTGVAFTDYKFFEEQVSNKGKPGFLKITEFEKKGGEHTRQIWKFPGRTIIRQANWELEFSRDENYKLSDITETGIGKTRKVTRKTYSGETLTKFSKVVNYLRELNESWGKSISAQYFIATSSFDKTVKVFYLDTGELFTTFKGHSKNYGKVKGHYKVYSVVSQAGSRIFWSAGAGQHIHGWDPVIVRNEDGTAGDMENRFSKEPTVKYLKHSFNKNIFKLNVNGENLFAVSADGTVKAFNIHDGAQFSAELDTEKFTYQLSTDYLFFIDIHKKYRLALVGTFDGKSIIFNIKNGKIVNTIKSSPGN